MSLDDDADFDPDWDTAGLTAGKTQQDRLEVQSFVKRNYDYLREVLGYQARLREAQLRVLPISKHPFTARVQGFGFADMISGRYN